MADIASRVDWTAERFFEPTLELGRRRTVSLPRPRFFRSSCSVALASAGGTDA